MERREENREVKRERGGEREKRSVVKREKRGEGWRERER